MSCLALQCFKMQKNDLKTGSKFKHFSELYHSIQIYEEKRFCKLKNVDSKSVECANKKVKGKLFDTKFKYAYVKFACKHAGTYSPRGRGDRPNQRYALTCT